MGGGHFHVLKNDFGRVRSVLPHFIERFAYADPFPIPINDEKAHARVTALGAAHFRSRISENSVKGGIGGAGDKGFTTIEDVMIAIFHGRGADTSYILSLPLVQ